MTNFEKYMNEITTTTFGLIDGKIEKCFYKNCKNCSFNDDEMGCSEKRMQWLKKKCKTPTKSIKQKLSETFNENISCTEPCDVCPFYSRNNSHGIPCNGYVNEIFNYIQSHEEDMNRWIGSNRLK